MKTNRTGKRPRFVFGLLGILPLIGACSSAVEPLSTLWEGDLVPVLPSTVSGLVAAVTHFGRTDISIVIEQAEADATYGWRIDSGTCAESGTIQGGRAAYPDLVASESGTGGGDARISTQFHPDFQLAARVFQTLGSAEQIVACGELELVG